MNSAIKKTNPQPETQPPASLVSFQQNLGKFLRDPHHEKRPTGTPVRAGQVYHELLFNNLREFLDSCFPICQQMISPLRWQRLCRVYFRDWHSHSPIFTDIPAEFVDFLDAGEHSQPLPAWFTELAHYEWVELAVDIHPENVAQQTELEDAELTAKVQTALAIGQLRLNPTLQNMHYRWPVHKLSAEFRTRKCEDTYILIYRDADHDVRFMHTNAMTSMLLAYLDEIASLEAPHDTSRSQSLTEFAKLIHYPSPEQLAEFAIPLLADLVGKQVLELDV